MLRLLQDLSTVEVVLTQHLAESSIEVCGHAVGLRRLALRQPVFDTQALAQLIDLVLSRVLAAATAEQPSLLLSVRMI